MIKKVTVRGDEDNQADWQVNVLFSVSKEDMHSFALFSGDINPIHHDIEYAVQRGFKGPIVYGGLFVALISQIIGNHLPGPGGIWHDLKLRFKEPLYIDEDAEIVGKVIYHNRSIAVLRLSLKILAGRRLIADGQVQAGWR